MTNLVRSGGDVPSFRADIMSIDGYDRRQRNLPSLVVWDEEPWAGFWKFTFSVNRVAIADEVRRYLRALDPVFDLVIDDICDRERKNIFPSCRDRVIETGLHPSRLCKRHKNERVSRRRKALGA